MIKSAHSLSRERNFIRYDKAFKQELKNDQEPARKRSATPALRRRKSMSMEENVHQGQINRSSTPAVPDRMTESYY